jgi:hypothetical protein
MSDNLADIWNQKIEEAEDQTVDKVFAGYPVKARPIPLSAMLRAGSLPQVFVEHMLRLDNDPEYREQAATVQSPEHYKRTLDYQREVIASVIAEPRFVFNGAEPGPGEVSYARFVKVTPKFVDEVIAWVEGGCPDVPVKLKGGGETTVDSLAGFSDSGQGRERPKPRNRGAGKGRKRR